MPCHECKLGSLVLSKFMSDVSINGSYVIILYFFVVTLGSNAAVEAS